MKRVAVALLIVLTAQVAHAQSTHSIRIAFGPGLSFPVGPEDFHDFWTIGPALSAGLSYTISPHFAASLLLDGSINSLNEGKAAEKFGVTRQGIDGAGGRITMLTAIPNLKVYLRSPESKSRLYVRGGAGLYRISTGAQGITAGGTPLPLEPPNTETTIAAQFGAGVEYVTSGKVNVFLEGRFLTAFTENDPTQTIQFRVGVMTK